MGEIIDILESYFDCEIFATRLNFYADNSAWKPFHKDSHAYAKGGIKEDFTIGLSLGATRALVFKHAEGEQQFSFPQANGDVFAFDTKVNDKFLHGVPKAKERVVGPRFSIIAWGRRRTLNERNAGVSDVGVARDPFPAAPKRRVDAPQSSEKSNLIADDDDDEQNVSPTNEADTD